MAPKPETCARCKSMSRLSLSRTMRSTISLSVSSVGTFPPRYVDEEPAFVEIGPVVDIASRHGRPHPLRERLDAVAKPCGAMTRHRHQVRPDPKPITLPVVPVAGKLDAWPRRSRVRACVLHRKSPPRPLAQPRREAREPIRNESSSVVVKTIGTDSRTLNDPSRRRSFRGVGNKTGEERIHRLY